MRKLRDKRNRLVNLISKYELNYKKTTQEEYLVTASGVINVIWNNWNNYWREFMLSHINGGFYIDNTRLVKQFPYNDNVAICYLCYLHKNTVHRHTPSHTLSGSHLELTWGDIDKIEDMLFKLLNQFPVNRHLNYVLSLVGSYKTEIKHFQKIRNGFIHLNNSKILDFQNLRSHYLFSSSHKPIDIIESIHMGSNDRCMNHLLNNMRGFLIQL
ncbi:hypothetical protein J2X77_000318 [Sphingobacterium sp. 2149]|nr:hypothetical protein [Sphingobacterium sp. 2149]